MLWINATEAEISIKLSLLRILSFGELIVTPEGVSAQFFPVYALYWVLLKHPP